VIAWRQLIQLGMSGQAIQHRLAKGRLHRIERGVYAVGRRELSQHGRWMAAVLGGGQGAVLSHTSAAVLWGLVKHSGRMEISVPVASGRRRPGVTVHRRPHLPQSELTTYQRIPVTTPVRTLIDIARGLGPARLERAINEADRLDLVDPERLLAALDGYAGQPGVRPLRALLGKRTFRLTDSELERRFLRIVAEAGLPMPETGRRLNGFKVDFFWPGLGLVVETDGLRYHRTPAQQARDRVRDQAHLAAGLAPLRFTHAQVRFETGLRAFHPARRRQ
jgi:very-short-patch-repair endonuclease